MNTQTQNTNSPATLADAQPVTAAKRRMRLDFPFNTRLKLSTLVRIACEVERERGSSPRCTVNERREQLARVAGDCRTISAAREAIKNE